MPGMALAAPGVRATGGAQPLFAAVGRLPARCDRNARPFRVPSPDAAVLARASSVAEGVAAGLAAEIDALVGLPVARTMGGTPLGEGGLVENDTYYVERHRIRGSEAGADQAAHFTAIANLLQEAGGNHGVTLWGRTKNGFGSPPGLQGSKLVFAATRIQLQVERYPEWGDVVEVRTWFTAADRLTADRNWLITDAASGEVLARATSTWVCLNLETRRLAKPPAPLRAVLERFSPTPTRDAVPRDEARLKLPALDELPGEQFDGPEQVAGRSDVDLNGHINNVAYFRWALEAVPHDVASSAHLLQVEMDFKAESHPRDRVHTRAKPVPAAHLSFTNGGRSVVQYCHSLERCCEARGCTELVRARSTWLLPRQALA